MKYKNIRAIITALFLALIWACSLWAGTTGKIAGIIIDKTNGDPLPGANVAINNTQLGAAADLNGQYTILYVPPGIYDIRVTMMGYTEIIVSDVRVRIDQTTRIDLSMEMEAVEGEMVTIVAQRTVIKEDVATSSVAVSDREVAELPVSSVESVVGLQAGIQGGLTIRGGGSTKLFTCWMVLPCEIHVTINLFLKLH